MPPRTQNSSELADELRVILDVLDRFEAGNGVDAVVAERQWRNGRLEEGSFAPLAGKLNRTRVTIDARHRGVSRQDLGPMPGPARDIQDLTSRDQPSCPEVARAMLELIHVERTILTDVNTLEVGGVRISHGQKGIG